MTTIIHPMPTMRPAERVEFPPDVLEPDALECHEPDSPFEVVSYSVLKTAIKACAPLIILAALGAVVVARVVLGAKLMLIGFVVAFLMIMFIGLPLMLASINDAVESGQSH